MHIVIMGCGRVGSALAKGLEMGDHTVAIIDRDAGAFRRLHADFAGERVTGVGFDRDTLVEAGIDRAGSRHSDSMPAGISRRMTWSAVQRTVATVGMPSFW